MMKSICAVCGHKKSMFIKKKPQKGKGVVDKFISNLPFEAHLLVSDPGTGAPVKASFIGPGTKLNKRLVSGTNNPQEW